MKKCILLFLLTLISMMAGAKVEIGMTYYNLNADNMTAEVAGVNYTGEICIPESVVYEDNVYLVTRIGNYAFANCSDVVSITIPEGVMSIGTAAFSYCSSLVSINIPKSVVDIGPYAFSRCGLVTTQSYSHDFLGSTKRTS